MAGIFSKYIFNNAIFNTDSAQIQGGGGPPPSISVSKANSFHVSKHEWEVKEFERIQKERKQAEAALEAKEREIAALEKKRKKALSDKNMQLELIALFEQADRLEKERQALADKWQMFMRDEEDIVIILSCLTYSS